MNKKKLFAVALSGIIGVGATGLTSINAAGTNPDGKTTVSYSNENIISSDNGMWMGVIPSNVSLKDSSLSKDIFVELKAGDGFEDITKFHDGFKVDVKVTSANSFTLVDGAKVPVSYSVDINGTILSDPANAGEVVELTKAKPKQEGTISTVGTRVVGGYKDTLTFAFTPSSDNPYLNS